MTPIPPVVTDRSGPAIDRISIAAFHACNARELRAFARLCRDIGEEGHRLRCISEADQEEAKADAAIKGIVR